MLDFVSYMRVSTDKQGITGLGMDAQREAVRRYVDGRGHIIAEFIEVESGKKHTNRPQLLAAIAECRKRRAMLLIARLDRLARNVAFIANLMNSDVEFVAVEGVDGVQQGHCRPRGETGARPRAHSSVIEVLVEDIDRLAREVKEMKVLPPVTKRKIGFDL